MSQAQTLLPGAESWAADGGPVGVLCLHGFTGHPGSMRALAEEVARSGCAVEVPCLPGHGTRVEDMLETGWADWTAAAAGALARLEGRCEVAIVVGQSMGGALAAWLAARSPDVAGFVAINPIVQPPDEAMLEIVRAMVADGEQVVRGGASDIADPEAVETAYADTPLVPLLSLAEGLEELQHNLDRITCPVLVVTSLQDHVVDPANSSVLAAAVRGPVERIELERSFHVATLDYEAELIRAAVVRFAAAVREGLGR